jgi:ferric-dicitrate binding protein FerR (iron transport regulator)
MMNNLQELLERYINRTATEEEKEVFFALLESGQFDDILIREGVTEMLDAKLDWAATDQKALYDSREKIYAALLRDNRIPVESKVVPIRTTRSWVWVSAAAVVSIAMVVYVGLTMKTEPVPLTQVIAQKQVPKPASYLGKQLVDLPDGTRVILNENTELSYEPSFGVSNREVTLTGEASFDVTHDPARPFIVRTGKVNTKVLGTAFNISAYPGQNKITVTVLRGIVEVGDDQHVYGKIRPDQQMAVNTTTYDFVKKNTKAEEGVAWQNNFLILDDVTLEEAATRIGKKFHVSIIFENPALKDCMFYGSFLNDENLTDILTMMSPVLHINYKVENGTVVISGKGCS